MYSDLFKEAVEFAVDKKMLVGTGNPNSDILLIGKESAIDREKCADQFLREIERNPTDWLENISENAALNDVPNWFHFPHSYNPLYPYKGQFNKVESRDKNNQIIRGKGGTSRTCFNYQKITDHVFRKNEKSSLINFHEFTFSTELNQITGKYSKDVPKKLRIESINNRCELLSKPFFKNFEITIVAASHYVRDFDINLCKIFEVEFDAGKSEQEKFTSNREFINIHYDNLYEPNRMLLHTNQLSMVSSQLIQRISQICKSFNENSKKWKKQ
jgi:hypothetical protein